MRSFFSFFIYLLPIIGFTQNSVEPGDKTVNAAIVNTGLFDCQWYKNAGSAFGDELGKEIVRVQRSNQKIIYVKRRISTKLGIDETDSLVLDAKTLEPVYRSYKGEEVSYFIQYGTAVKGVRTILETKKKETLSEPLDGKYYDKESLPLVVSSLPLSSGYQAAIAVIDYNSEFKPVYYKYRITEVADMQTISERSGKHAVWKVTVQEKKQGYEYLLYIDKLTRRILRTDFLISSALLTYNFFDKETDINPIKAPFNANETIAMITKGTSSIKGQAYSRPFDKRKAGFKNRKQYAEKGSAVLLIPNTPYFKEWTDYNLNLQKLSGPAYTIDWGGAFGQTGEKDRTIIGNLYPLPPEVAKCMLTTTVYDDNGNFVFQNLKPGEYLVFVSYRADKYSHTTKDATGDYTIALNSDGSGTVTSIKEVNAWLRPTNIKAYKYIKVNKEGETVDVIFND